MPRAVFNYQVDINASPEKVFSYIEDFTKHGEWSDGLSIEAVSDAPIGVGSEYKSVGKQLGKDTPNNIKIVEYDSPNRLCFVASDGKMEFLQEMTFTAHNGSTLMERRVSFDLNPILFVLFKILIGPLAANPSMNKSLKKLKANLES